MNRRQFLTAGVAASAVLATADAALSPIQNSAAFAWPHGCIEHLPASESKRIAWTVDDGASVTALRSYIDLLEKHEDLRMTMFVLAGAHSWKTLANPLSELAQSGQLQMANHTVNHINLTHATNRKIKQELVLAGRFIEDNFGVQAGPYWRPPYGYINQHVMKVAAEAGFDRPVLWYGSTGSNSGVSSAAVWANCQKWMQNGRIVIDHANSQSTVNNFGRIRALLAARHLQTVTLTDAFGALN